MSWNWNFGYRGRSPHPGVRRRTDADSLIDRLMRHWDLDPAAPRVMPDALANEIKRKLDDHVASPANTVVSSIGTGFESGDRAEMTFDHGGLRFRIEIEAFDFQDYVDDFDWDDDEI